MENKRFYRSSKSSYIGGVCGGIAEYFNIDPVLVRIIFILVFIYGGAGLLIYLILWVITPKEPFDYSKFNSTGAPGSSPDEGANTETSSGCINDMMPGKKSEVKKNGALVGGIILVTIGTLFLFDNLIRVFDFSDFWPVVLVILGVAIIATSINNKNKNNNEL